MGICSSKSTTAIETVTAIDVRPETPVDVYSRWLVSGEVELDARLIAYLEQMPLPYLKLMDALPKEVLRCGLRQMLSTSVSWPKRLSKEQVQSLARPFVAIKLYYEERLKTPEQRRQFRRVSQLSPYLLPLNEPALAFLDRLPHQQLQALLAFPFSSAAHAKQLINLRARESVYRSAYLDAFMNDDCETLTALLKPIEKQKVEELDSRTRAGHVLTAKKVFSHHSAFHALEIQQRFLLCLQRFLAISDQSLYGRLFRLLAGFMLLFHDFEQQKTELAGGVIATVEEVTAEQVLAWLKPLLVTDRLARFEVLIEAMAKYLIVLGTSVIWKKDTIADLAESMADFRRLTLARLGAKPAGKFFQHLQVATVLAGLCDKAPWMIKPVLKQQIENAAVRQRISQKLGGKLTQLNELFASLNTEPAEFHLIALTQNLMMRIELAKQVKPKRTKYLAQAIEYCRTGADLTMGDVEAFLAEQEGYGYRVMAEVFFTEQCLEEELNFNRRLTAYVEKAKARLLALGVEAETVTEIEPRFGLQHEEFLRLLFRHYKVLPELEQRQLCRELILVAAFQAGTHYSQARDDLSSLVMRSPKPLASQSFRLRTESSVTITSTAPPSLVRGNRPGFFREGARMHEIDETGQVSLDLRDIVMISSVGR